MSTAVPSTVSSTAVSLPSASLSLSDPHTWVGIVTALAAVGTTVFHQSLAPYIPLATIVIAGIVAAALLISKHQYAAALVAGSNSLASSASVAPTDLVAEIQKAAAVASALSTLQASIATTNPPNQTIPR